MSKQYLDRLYSKLERTTEPDGSASLLYTVIQIKKENPALQETGQSLYLDVKQFIEHYISCARVGNIDFGYDQIDVHKITDAIDSLSLSCERSRLMQNAADGLSGQSMAQEGESMRSFYLKEKVRQAFSEHSAFGYLRGLGYLSISSVWAVMVVLTVVFVFEYVITLPLSDETHALFSIEHEGYGDNMFLNHLLTYFASVFEMTDVSFCTARNIPGFVILMCFKMFYILYGGWNAVDIIRKKLSIPND